MYISLCEWFTTNNESLMPCEPSQTFLMHTIAVYLVTNDTMSISLYNKNCNSVGKHKFINLHYDYLFYLIPITDSYIVPSNSDIFYLVHAYIRTYHVTT